MSKHDGIIQYTEEELQEREYLADETLVPDIPEEITDKFEEVLDTYKEYTSGSKPEDAAKDEEFLRRAFYFAYKAHRNQKRKTGEPYIIHPIAVAKILADLKVDSETLAAALMHDTIEDTVADSIMLTEKFGATVTSLVEGVTKLNTKLDNVVYDTKTDIQASNVRKMLLAMTNDIRIIFIKLADRLHNMRTLKFQSPEKQIEKAQETLDIYVPFAGRFGIYRIKWELEDLCLMYLHPEEYNKLIKLVSGDRNEREDFMEQVISEIRSKLTENGITHFDIEGRPKHFYSIYKKMHDKGKTIDEIYDLYACRIIVDEVTECYQVLGIIHEIYQHVPGRFKDYIAMPKENKYQSIHTTVVSHVGIPFEVQIRTYRMHQTAEYGIAAHWHYKEEGSSTEFKADKYDEKIDEVRQIIETQSELSDSSEFLESLKMNIAPDEIFVYTPKHALVKLPQGSCPIDFAYAIHSGIGNHMHGAKVNGRLVPLSYELKNSDIVEVLSSEKLVKGPSRDWLKIVRSANARTKINAWFKREARPDNIEQGKKELTREIERNGFDPAKLLMHRSLETILRRNNFQGIDDMYAAIGYGSISVIKVFSRLRDDYIRSCSEEERAALGYRVTADGNVAYNPPDLPIQLGKFDQSHSKGKAPSKNSDSSSKKVESYDIDIINALNADPHQIAGKVRAGDLEEQQSRNAKILAGKRAHASSEVIVDGLEGIATHLANCCHPVYGDEIVGYVTQENGVGIHKTTCNNIRNIVKNREKSDKDMEKFQRLVTAKWLAKAQFASYDIRLVVICTDRQSLLFDVLDKINEERINVKALTTVKDGQVARIFITVNISGKEQYDRLVARIKTVKDVSDVIRD